LVKVVEKDAKGFEQNKKGGWGPSSNDRVTSMDTKRKVPREKREEKKKKGKSRKKT